MEPVHPGPARRHRGAASGRRRRAGFTGRDREQFPGFYAWAEANATLFGYMEDSYFFGSSSAPSRSSPGRSATGPRRCERDIANLTAALAERPGCAEAFLPVVAPASVEVGLADEYYGSRDDLMRALADALQRGVPGHRRRRVHRCRSTTPGCPPPGTAAPTTTWTPTAGTPPAASRCSTTPWTGCPPTGSATTCAGAAGTARTPTTCRWRTSPTSCSGVNAGAYLVEAANSRHEHEYHLWEDLKLPDGKILIPGVVTHATNIIEHPELVAERITRYTDRLGAENVIAGADCGFGSRIHPELGWAKLSALAEGAALASSRIWKG